MSGVTGSNRINRSEFVRVYNEYKKNILEQLPGYVKSTVTGSIISDPLKNDFGDIDVIVQFDVEQSKMALKLNLIKILTRLPKDVIIPFQSPKYHHKRVYNSGEIITISYPQGNGKTVQIDNIIALSNQELEFKQHFLNWPAQNQGLILGLVKVIILEEGVDKVLRRMNMFIDYKNECKLEDNQELEFNLSSSALQLRRVTYYPGTYKQKDKEILWISDDIEDVKLLLHHYNLNDNFHNLLYKADRLLTSQRSRNRIYGLFNSMVSVKSGEVGTRKGLIKEQSKEALKLIIKPEL